MSPYSAPKHKQQIPARVSVAALDRCKLLAAKQNISFAEYMEKLMSGSDDNNEFDEFKTLISDTLIHVLESIDKQGEGGLNAVQIETLLLVRVMAKSSLVKEVQKIMTDNDIIPYEVGNA